MNSGAYCEYRSHTSYESPASEARFVAWCWSYPLGLDSGDVDNHFLSKVLQGLRCRRKWPTWTRHHPHWLVFIVLRRTKKHCQDWRFDWRKCDLLAIRTCCEKSSDETVTSAYHKQIRESSAMWQIVDEHCFGHILSPCGPKPQWQLTDTMPVLDKNPKNMSSPQWHSRTVHIS